MENTVKKAPSGCLGFMLNLIPIVLFVITLGTKSILFAVIATITAISAFWYTWFQHRARLSRLSGSFSSHRSEVAYYSEEDLATIMVQEAMAQRFDQEAAPVALRTLMPRALVTAGCLLLNALLIWFSYHTLWVYPLCCLLFYVWERLYLHFDTVPTLIRKAKKQLDTPVTQLIDEEVVDDREVGRSKQVLFGGIALLLASVALVVYCNWAPRMAFGTTPDGYCLIDYKPGVFTTVAEIPASHNSRPVLAIESGAFAGCHQLKEITIPDSVVRIGGEAFQNCSSLRSIVIPTGVTEIRGNSFEGCKSLTSVTLHDDIIDIHAYAFAGCSSLRTIDLPDHITEIHAYTFEGCSDLIYIVIPDRVTRIAAHAFYGCSDLQKVTVPDSVREIGSSAFRKCSSLYAISVPYGTYINERAFKESPTNITYR